MEELLTAEEKKRLEEDRKNRAVSPCAGASGSKPNVVQNDAVGMAAVLASLLGGAGHIAGGGGGTGNLLSMIAAGAKPNRTRPMIRTKANSSCFACQGYGHWANDPECPLKTKNKVAKKDNDEEEG